MLQTKQHQINSVDNLGHNASKETISNKLYKHSWTQCIKKQYQITSIEKILFYIYMKTLRKKRKQNKTKKQFLFNPDDPKKSFDVYIDKNPKDTIPIKYTTVEDVRNTINKLEKLYKNKKYPHKRIWQVGMIMKVRLEVLKDKKPKQYNLSKRYFEFLGNRTKLEEKERYKVSFY